MRTTDKAKNDFKLLIKHETLVTYTMKIYTTIITVL